LDPTDGRLALALELAEAIQDFPRHLATHVGGFVMSRGPLTEMAVITNAAMEGRTVLEWDKDDIDALGLLKVDILGLGMLSCLRRGFDLLRRHHRLDLGLADVPRDCPETYAMLRRADSLGVFQVESRARWSRKSAVPRALPCGSGCAWPPASRRRRAGRSPGHGAAAMARPLPRQRKWCAAPVSLCRRAGHPKAQRRPAVITPAYCLVCTWLA
jgi:hypothetical protein